MSNFKIEPRFLSFIKTESIQVTPPSQPSVSFPYGIPGIRVQLETEWNLRTPDIYFGINKNYNFYIKNYEEEISKEESKERIIPNIFSFCMSEEELQEDSIQKNHLNLCDSINQFQKKQYFDVFAKELSLKTISEKNSLSTNYEKIVVPYLNLDFSTRCQNEKVLFPMFFDMNISSRGQNFFKELFTKNHLMSILMAQIAKSLLGSTTINFDINDPTKLANDPSSRIKIDIKSIDIEQWLNSLKTNNNIPNIFVSNDTVFLGPRNSESLIIESFNIYKVLIINLVLNKIKDFLNNEQFVREGLNYSECLFYKVEKLKGNDLIQTFFIPNTGDNSYIDSQVKYNTDYTYKIYSYQITLFRKEIPDPQSRTLKKEIKSISLLEVPLDSFQASITDNPPPSPQIDVIPYRGVKDKLLFNIVNSSGRYELFPVTIEQGDLEKINVIKEPRKIYEDVANKNLANVNVNNFLGRTFKRQISRDIGAPTEAFSKNKVTFFSNDPPSVFEVFRLTTKPKSYEDFAGNKLVSIFTETVNNFSSQLASAASFVDDISPNTKYYYTFRATDVHGHISNPSPIYLVEIVSDQGIYPIIQIYNFEEEKQISNRTMKKFLQIKPSYLQTSPNVENNNPNLGIADTSIWGKKFKIRLTSQKTGKQIDLNFKCIKTEQES